MTILNYLGLLKSKEKDSLIKYEKKKLFNHRKIHVGHIEGELNQPIAQEGCNQTAQQVSIKNNQF